MGKLWDADPQRASSVCCNECHKADVQLSPGLIVWSVRQVQALDHVKAMSCCSHCGKQRKALKRCPRCKQASYCGAACQNAAWTQHKGTCVTLDEVFEKWIEAGSVDDWRGELKWEGRMEEMLDYQTVARPASVDAGCATILAAFVHAHAMGFDSRGNIDHVHSIIRLEARHAELLGKMQRFRDQGEALCSVAEHLLYLGKRQEAAENFKRARRIAESHGFFSVECESCLGLGRLAMAEGRSEEGVEMLRNALVCAPLREGEDDDMELNVLLNFTNALFLIDAIDEVEPLVARFRETAQAESGMMERTPELCFYDMHILYSSAHLHEVLLLNPERGGGHTARPRWEALYTR